MSSSSQHSRSEHRQSLVSHRSYQLWASTLAKIAKTPRGLDKPRAQYSDLELCGYILQENKEGVQQLWETFTTDRKEVSRYLMDPKRESTVYLLGFHLANQARLSMALDRAEYRHRLLSQLARAESVKLVDLGSGTGALSLQTAQELWTYREALPIEWELIDRSSTFLEAAATGIELLKPGTKPVLRRQKLDEYLQRELRAPMDDQISWYQLGYVWNEISFNQKTRQLLMNYLGKGLENGKRVITILEPATQDMARTTMQLRDELVEMGYVSLYPCPHSNSCPMLERDRDWCYSEAVWDRPPLMKKVDKMLKIDRQRIGVGAYVFVSPDLLVNGKVVPGASQPVVVGRPVEKTAKLAIHQQISYLMCTPEAELTKEKAKKGPIELLRGQYYRELPAFEKTAGAAKDERTEKPKVVKDERSEKPKFVRGERSEKPRFGKSERSEKPRFPKDRSEKPHFAKEERADKPRASRDDAPREKKKAIVERGSEKGEPRAKPLKKKKTGFGLAKSQNRITVEKKTASEQFPMKDRRK